MNTATGNDTTGTGTSGNPYQTIQKGIDSAMLIGVGGGEVRVSGTTTVSTANPFQLKNGIRLLGGYNASWVRDLSSPSLIQDTTTGNQTIIGCTSISAGTTLEGFRIEFSNNSAASITRTIINCSATGSASVIIANNDLFSPNSNNSSNSAMFVSGGANHQIYNNRIVMRSITMDTRFTNGINASVASHIYNNVVYTADATGNGGYGIQTVRGSIIRNNTIAFNNATSRYGIQISSGTTGDTYIQNNILYASATGGTCVYAGSATQKPHTLANNSMFNCATNYYLEASTAYSHANIGTAGMTASSGNLEYDMVGASCFTNTGSWDWSLTGSCATSVTQGGLNGSTLSWGFTTDYARSTRTAPWSIGAFERD